MEADIECAILILGLMFAIVFIVRGLSAIASMIDMFKFAYGAFVLLGTTPLARALVGLTARQGDQYPPLLCQSDHHAQRARHDEGSIA
jgi:hypothetical protein